MKLSIIVPCKNEENNVTKLYESINDTLGKIKYEIIFVDDGSVDNTLKEMKELYEKDVQHIKILSFSRNFQKEAAIFAGLEFASGKYTCIVDGDLQHNPKYLLDMYNYLEENNEYDCIAMVAEINNNDSFFKKICKKKFYSIMNKHSEIKMKSGISDFRMFRKNVKDSIINFRENNRFIKGVFEWVGFNTKYMFYKVDERKHGISSWSFKNSLNYSINGYCEFSYKILEWPIKLGLFSIFSAFVYLIILLVMMLGFNFKIKAAYIIILLLLLFFGIQFLFTGIIGKYISLINNEVKNRPLYIIKEKIGFNSETIL